MKSFEGKVAVVTGAASGIGRALARRLAAADMKVVLADVEADPLQRAAAEIQATGADAMAVRTDVSSQDAMRSLAEQTLERYGAVHVLCNNAGVFAGGVSWLAPQSDFDWVFGVNVWGILNGLRAFVPIMLEQQTEGHVVNTISMAGVTTAPFTSPYYMSKHAAMCLSETLYFELKEKGGRIGVSALCPEVVSTSIGNAERNRPEHLKRKTGEGESPERDLVEGALRGAIPAGVDPSVLAERAFQAIVENRFYVLTGEDDGWRKICNARLEDIRLARNPGFVTPEV